MSRGTKVPIQVLSITAAAVLAEAICVDAAGAIAATGTVPFGVTIDGNDTIGDAIAVGTDGAFLVTASAAVVINTELVVTGVLGKVKTAVPASGDAIVAVALEAAAADGDLILAKLQYRGVA